MHTYNFIIEADVEAFIVDLEKRKNLGDKQAKVMWDKIIYIMERVRLQGTRAGTKFIKDLKGKENENLYEIRPNDERIFMCMWNGNHFVMLSHYTKDSNETDRIELARARRLRDQYLKDHPTPIDKEPDKQKMQKRR